MQTKMSIVKLKLFNFIFKIFFNFFEFLLTIICICGIMPTFKKKRAGINLLKISKNLSSFVWHRFLSYCSFFIEHIFPFFYCLLRHHHILQMNAKRFPLFCKALLLLSQKLQMPFHILLRHGLPDAF